jgi:FkbM family methyltransferase
MPRIFKSRYYGLEGLDEKLRHYTTKKGGYFVELGANDGLSQSNTKHFELFQGWQGVLVEPYKGNFDLIAKNRAKRTLAFHAACVSFSYEKPEVELVFANLMTTPLGLETDLSDALEHIASGERHLNAHQHIHSFNAPARTLNSILVESDAPSRIDLLSLDVEGAEIEVLRGLNHSQFRFDHIIVECRVLETMETYLKGLGYGKVSQLSKHDYLFADLSHEL